MKGTSVTSHRLSLRLFRSLGVAAAGLALTTLAACGGPDGADAPKDASVKDFCNAIGDWDGSDPGGLVDDMVDVGTPSDIPEEARAGFEAMIENATADKISHGTQEKVNTFITYITDTCVGIPAE